VAKPQRNNGLRDALVFIVAERQRLSVTDSAEGARPGTMVSENKKGGGAIFRALSLIGAPGFLADSGEAFGVGGLLDVCQF
jgi:hypothetical protein